jgi:hypothetical protein
MRKLLFAALLLSLLPAGLFAQTEWGLFSQTELWQASRLNPAFWTDQKLVVMLPGIQNTLYFTGPTYGDVIREENGDPVLDVDALIDKLEPDNIVREQLELNTLGLAIRLGPSFGLSFQHKVHFNAYLAYPKALPQLIWKGNAQFIGQTIELDHDLQLNAFNEFALGGYFETGPLQVGARVKLLTGIGDVSTSRQRASLTTDTAFYQLQFLADYQLNTSSYFDYQSYDDLQLDYNFGQLQLNQLFTSNPGLAFDLGVRLGQDSWWLAASVLNLGSIRWNEDVKNYRADGDYTFDGLDISQALTGDSVELEDALDTLRQLFAFEPTNDPYSTALPTEVYISGGLQLNENWHVGGALFSEWYRGKFAPGFSVFAGARPFDWLQLGASYAVFRNTYTNLGLSASAKLGPVQVYAMADNLPAAFSPSESRFFHLRAGLNLVFGKVE